MQARQLLHAHLLEAWKVLIHAHTCTHTHPLCLLLSETFDTRLLASMNKPHTFLLHTCLYIYSHIHAYTYALHIYTHIHTLTYACA
jgi:hypothetical protein